jgi:hypothetical protein
MTHVLETTIDPLNAYCNSGNEAHDEMTRRRIIAALGYIPYWLFDPNFTNMSAVECLHENYAHGGGWIPSTGFTHKGDGVLAYEGDPDLIPLALFERTTEDTKKEKIYQYSHGWVMVLCDDGAIRVARLD